MSEAPVERWERMLETRSREGQRAARQYLLTSLEDEVARGGSCRRTDAIEPLPAIGASEIGTPCQLPDTPSVRTLTRPTTNRGVHAGGPNYGQTAGSGEYAETTSQGTRARDTQEWIDRSPQERRVQNSDIGRRLRLAEAAADGPTSHRIEQSCRVEAFEHREDAVAA